MPTAKPAFALLLLLSASAEARDPLARMGGPERADRYDALIVKHARAFGLDPRLVKAVIAAESEFVRTALSPAGARGLMQLMPGTAAEVGVAPELLGDPDHNIRAGTAYLSRLCGALARRLDARGGCVEGGREALRRLVAAYHAGPRALESEERWPAATRRYVGSVLDYYGSDVSELRRDLEGP